MNDMISIWLFIIPFAVAAAIPGPAQGALIGHVLSRGGRASVPFIVGMVLGNAVWLIVATLGLAALALRFEHIFIAVKWLGIAYLVFIAWKLWSADSLQAQPASSQSVRRGVLTGSFLTLSNPKAVIFFGAVLPHAFDMTALSWSEIGLIAALGVAIDLTIQLAYLAAASKVRNAVRSPKAMKRVNRTSAGLMAGCAGWLAFSQ
jgi:threonine/homoserine/homoserine lactone efflux protein